MFLPYLGHGVCSCQTCNTILLLPCCKRIEILNDHHLEKLVHFPTREKNTFDLIITSLPSQFLDIQSPDRLSDHDILSGTLKMVIPPINKNLGGRYIIIRRVTMNL